MSPVYPVLFCCFWNLHIVLSRKCEMCHALLRKINLVPRVHGLLGQRLVVARWNSGGMEFLGIFWLAVRVTNKSWNPTFLGFSIPFPPQSLTWRRLTADWGDRGLWVRDWRKNCLNINDMNDMNFFPSSLCHRQNNICLIFLPSLKYTIINFFPQILIHRQI